MHLALSTPKDYTVSLHYDRRLYGQDIAGSVAHARMLARQGIVSDKDAELIVMGLTAIRQEIEGGAFPWRPELEDIHMNIEARLHERIGDAAGKLHTARSRNDQVATDMRLFAKEAIQETAKGLRALQKALLDQAEANLSVVMPGYTHLQRAQPVLLAHHLLAYFHMLERDVERFRQAYQRADVLPLGSGALAGVPYPIDREFVAGELGFSRISENSMDAVADRDFLLDYHSAAATCMMHLSRLAEEVVLWSSEELGFVRLAEEYTTGSSIMPQKRNPDFAELARGKTGRVYGHLMALLTVLKGLPLTYNRDLQEDKEGFFDTVDTLQATVGAFTGMARTMQVDADRCRRAAEGGLMLATDLADYLARRGVPFRQAHGIVRELCGYALKEGKALKEIGLKEYQRFSPLFQEDVLTITVESSIAARDVPGGTAPKRVRAALLQARKTVEKAFD
ncbi:MAG: argininosuccinate lyase [Chloroflexi bacterium]|nr:argininosuccinate lyase [Chloroflexota bacterium]